MLYSYTAVALSIFSLPSYHSQPQRPKYRHKMDRERRAKETQDLVEQSRQSFKEAFPVSARIQQLEAYLQDEKSMSHQHTNIRAALHMYQTGQLEYGYGYTLRRAE